jgi:hypothetical protein
MIVHLLRCMSPKVARTRPVVALSRCPLIEVDRKWLADGQTDAIDPNATSDAWTA